MIVNVVNGVVKLFDEYGSCKRNIVSNAESAIFINNNSLIQVTMNTGRTKLFKLNGSCIRTI